VNPFLLFALLLKASMMSFGGLASLAILHDDLIVRGISDATIGQALAIGRVSPGPNGLYMVSLGYQLAGLAGAALATLALMLPPFTVVLTAACYGRLSRFARTQSAMLMVSLALAGSLAYTAWQIIEGSAADPAAWVAGASAFAITAATRWHPMVVIGAAVVLGIVLYK